MNCKHETEKLISLDKRNESITCSKCGSSDIRVNSTSKSDPRDFKNLPKIY